MADRVGQQLGNYRLMQLLGRGGFAEVYLGQHLRLNTQAAIKVLHTQLADEDIQHFQDEAQTIANLDHPNIVRLQDFDVQNGTPFLVMQYAPNGSLRQRHSKGTRLPLETVVRYVQQVADALQYAHDQRLVHRDIKPENLLLGRREEILLSDFGIALVVQSSRYQSTQEVVGTILYMAPEQIQGKPRPASDQYSLAVMVYEWLAGERPFQGSMSEVVAQHLSVPPPPFVERVAGLSPAVEQVVVTALAKDPKERFGSVKAFANALYQASRLDLPTQISGPSAVFSQPIMPQPSSPVSAQLPPTIPVSSPPGADFPLMVQPSTWGGSGDSAVQESLHPPEPPKPEPSIKPKHTGRNILLSLLLVVLLVGGSVLGLNLTTSKQANIAPTPIPTATALPTATPTATINITGTWIGQDGYKTSTYSLTQSGSSITGTGSDTENDTYVISGSINDRSVMLLAHLNELNCGFHETLQLSADTRSMAGPYFSDCTGASLTITFTRQ